MDSQADDFEPNPTREADQLPRNRLLDQASRTFECCPKTSRRSAAPEPPPYCIRGTPGLPAIYSTVALGQLTVFIYQAVRLQQLLRQFWGVVLATQAGKLLHQ